MTGLGRVVYGQCVLLSGVVPSWVVVAEGDGTRLDDLSESERAYLARAGDKRRREFAAVRFCARTALAVLRRRREAMVPGASGRPTWPAGVVGSMTHCAHYCAAAVAEESRCDAIGIDAEPNSPLSEAVLRRISSPAERRRLHEISRVQPDVSFDRVLFSIKESVYKAWSSLTGEDLRFNDVEVFISGGGRAVVIPQYASGASASWWVAWAANGDTVGSAVVLRVHKRAHEM